MVKKLLLTFCFIAGTWASDLFAQSTPSSNKNIQQVPKTKNEQTPIRHRMPSLDFDAIGFSYSNNIVYFTMPDYITYITVSMESNDGEIFSSYVYAVNSFWSITLPSGEYYIECDADEGSHFEGLVYID